MSLESLIITKSIPLAFQIRKMAGQLFNDAEKIVSIFGHYGDSNRRQKSPIFRVLEISDVFSIYSGIQKNV